MRDYINTNICEVENLELLKANKFREVYLVNNKLVVMFSKNAKSIFNWYMSNQKFAPATLFGYEECICYDYLVPTSEYLKRSHMIDFFNTYRPKPCSGSSNDFYTHLENEYISKCKELGISPKHLNRPLNEGLYELHGNMDFDHTIVFDNKLIQLDPKPMIGPILFDIINMYLSNFRILEMFTRSELSELLNVDINNIDYYYEIILVSKMYKLHEINRQLYDSYLKLF